MKVILEVLLVTLVHSWVSTHHNPQGCPPPRLINIHINQLVGEWFQYVYRVVSSNSVALSSCENNTVTEDNGTYTGISISDNVTVAFSITELQGPIFYYDDSGNPRIQLTEIITGVTNDGTKISLANIFVSQRFSTTIVMLASRRGFVDPSSHERLLHTVGYHISGNSSSIPPSQCPTSA